MYKDIDGKIILIGLYDKINDETIWDKKVLVDNTEEYFKTIKNMNLSVELVGGISQKVKPYFDIDLKIEKNHRFDECSNLVKWSNEIQNMFKLKNGNDIYILKREPRQLETGETKYSYHIIVDKIKISHKNIKRLINQHNLPKEWDRACYSTNQGIYAPYVKGKKDNPDLPAFEPYSIFNGYIELDKVNIYNYSISYIEKDFKDWDDLIITEDKKLDYKIIKYDIIEEDDEELNNSNDTLNELTEKLKNISPTRYDDYDEWINIMFSIINISTKYKIGKKKAKYLMHEASQISKNYDEDKVDDWIQKNYDRVEGKQGYGFPYINMKLKEDNPEFYEKNMKKTYEIVKKEFDKKVFKCVNPLGFIVLNDKQDEINPTAYYIRDKKDLKIQFTELYYWDKDKNGKWNKMDFLPRWDKDDTKKIYESLTFKPYKLRPELAKDHFNLFKGFRAEKLPVYKDYDLIKPILDHIKIVLANNREDVYNYIIQYLAQIVQNPKKKTEVVMIWKGKQGCGKNTIVDLFANGIIGTEYSISASNPEKVFFGTFNSLLANKVLAVANEVNNEMRGFIDRVKDTATAPTINIEKKCKDPIVFDNYTNCLMTTNNDFPMVISTDDRRIVWLECSNEKINNKEYFEKLYDVCMTDEAVSSLYYYLLEEVKITIMNFQKDRPITKEYKKIQAVNIPNPFKFLISLENTLKFRKVKNSDEKVVLFTKKELYEKYKDYCEEQKKQPFPHDTFYYKILNDTGFKIVKQEGYQKIRIIKTVYEDWIKKYKDLEDEIEECNDILEDEYEFIEE